MDIKKYWEAIVKQNANVIRSYFKETAIIKWHNTNEQFTLEEFIRANCEYPGKWSCKIERVEKIGNLIITVVKILGSNILLSFHVVSFIKIEDNKIISIDEYWGDDGIAPEWRLNM